MTEPTLASQVFRLIEQAESYSDSQEASRRRALSFYNGDKEAIPYDKTFSSVVSKDVRKHVQKLMPSIMRTILSNDRVVEYMPAGPDDEGVAEQATDYVNAYVIPECDGERALHDAIFDALLLKTGVLNWTAYTQSRVVVQSYSGQPPEALLGLDEIGEVFDVKPAEDGTLSFSLRRLESETKVRLRAVPRGAFLIHPNATGIEDSPIVGERQLMTRSDLVSRGYDRDAVWAIGEDNEPADSDSDARRGEDRDDMDRDVAKAMETVKIYDVYAQLDLDGDGIAELHHFVMAEGTSKDETHIILDHEHATEIPYADVVCEYEAHQFEGHSVAEDLIDVQEVGTTLLRQSMDNIYEVNDPRPFVQLDAVEDADPLYKRVRGKPVQLASGRSAQEAVQFQPTPFIADKAMLMKQQMDAEAEDRTGITDAAGGLPGEALQGMTATSATILNEAAVARSEMMVRNLARGGIRKAFRGLLRLIIAHADRPRTVRLRGQWVEVNPAVWNAEMDCIVNVGLGTGTRERDMMMLQMILMQQEKILGTLGADNPLVKPDQLYNTLKKMVETAGFASADPYFTSPDPQEVAAKQQAAANQPNPEQIKAQTAMQLEQIKADARSQVEAAQLEADLRVKEVEIRANAALEQQKIAAKAELERMQAELDLLKHKDKMQLEWAKLNRETVRNSMEQGYAPL